MCGIVGYIGTQAASEILLAGLEKLEYRGYDSAGLATISEGEITCIRAKGKLHNLREKLAEIDSPAPIGIGHTRWATHGKPEEYNAHPHLDNSGRVAVVQNGIVENYRELRKELKAKGHKFVSDTDTEVIPHLIADFLAEARKLKAEGKEKKTDEIADLSFLEVVSKAVNRLEGAFAIAVICADFPDELIVARQQAPLVIGFGAGEFFCASDTPALISHTRAVLSLENGELARLTPMGVEVYSFAGQRLKKSPRILGWSPVSVEKQGFKHFMHKEIYEQPAVVRACLETYLDSDWQPGNPRSPINLNLPQELCADVEQISILACGTSWHASLIGKYLLEQLANIPTAVQYSSEYRYAPAPLTANTLIIGVTQSGETADTLAALGMEQQRRAGFTDKFRSRMLGITNRTESSIAHMMPHVINTHAGIEIGVAATKTFVSQLMAFYFLALDLAHQRQTISTERLAEVIAGLRQLPAEIEKFLEIQEQYVEELSHQFTETQDFIFLGRGINFPIALEGALKLKEI
ncbi:glutamine--fructose-6-phosphate transaminase (isomerizing), partial [Nostoc sp. HG1]|nr:glutamine--fructose-6-phosphate transaminase (isomerizing) [Nostoc sp. HG1]